jgi:hypothetical protein
MTIMKFSQRIVFSFLSAAVGFSQSAPGPDRPPHGRNRCPCSLRLQREQTLASHQERQRRVQQTIDKAYDDKLAGRISEEYWTERFNRWQEELADVRAQIRDLEGATFDSFKRADALLKLCRKAPALYRKQTFDEQARLLELITSNFSWDGVTLAPTYRKPFDQLAEGLLIMSGGAEGVAKQNLARFTQTLDGLPWKGLDGFYVGMMAA